MIIKALYDGQTEMDIETFEMGSLGINWDLNTQAKNGVVHSIEKVFPILSASIGISRPFLGYYDVTFPSLLLTAYIPDYDPETQYQEIEFMKTHVISGVITDSGFDTQTYTNLSDVVQPGHYLQFSNCKFEVRTYGIGGVVRYFTFEEDGQEIEYETYNNAPIILATVGTSIAILGYYYSRRDNTGTYPDDPTAYGIEPIGRSYYGYYDLENIYDMVEIMNWSKYFGLSGDLPVPPPVPVPNPFGDQSTATTGGGGGTYNFSIDEIPMPTVPSYSAISTKMFTCLVPTNEQMNDIASKFWSTSFLDAISRIFTANPLDSVLSLVQYPFKVNHNLVTNDLSIGGVSLDVSCNATTEQFITLDFGSLDFTTPLRNNFLDYEPYTNITLYLPYIGDIKLDCCDVWTHVISVKYRVDILTGSCIAFILVDNSVRYTKTGNCATNIPLSGRDLGSSAKSLLNVASNVVGGAVSGNRLSMVSSLGDLQPIPSVTYKNVTNNSLSMLESSICYLSITTVNESVSGDLSSLQGCTSNITNTLSNVHGYTQITSTHVENIVALDDELNEILELLKGGVILP